MIRRQAGRQGGRFGLSAALAAGLVLWALAAGARADEDAEFTALTRKLAQVFPAPSDSETPVVVAVAPMEAPEAQRTLATYVEDQFINALAGGGAKRIKVVSRRYREKVLDEMAFGSRPFTDPKTAVQPCKQLAARYLITGRVWVGAEVELTIKVVDVETRAILKAETLRLRIDNNMIDQLRLLQASAKQDVELPSEQFAGGTRVDRLVALADMYFERGKRDQAVQSYGRLLKYPDATKQQRAGLLARLGYAMQTSGRLKDAENSYKQSLALEPENPTVRAYLSVLQLQRIAVDVTRKRYGQDYGKSVDRLLAVWLGEQKAVERTIKEMFFGIELVVLKQDGGRFSTQKLAQGGTLYSGTSKFKVVFNADKPIWVYLWNMDSTGKIWPVWPDVPEGATAAWRSGKIMAGNNYQSPTGNNWFVLDRNVGTEFFFYVVSAQRVAELDRLMVYFRQHRNPTVEGVAPARPMAARGIMTRSVRGMSERGIMTTVTVETGEPNTDPVTFEMKTLALTGAEASGVIWFKHENPRK